MAKPKGARQQKRIAKQKAKRSEKRAALMRRESKDPTIRLRGAARWPVVQALVRTELWEAGIGSLVIARQESPGRVVMGCFLVDVYCLGVKDAFWRAGSLEEFKELVRRMEETQAMGPIAPECLVKIIQGAVAYAQSYGFSPHTDYGHAARLLEGIDPAACPQEFTFGRDGKPLYIQGPHESTFQAMNIAERLGELGGHYITRLSSREFDDEDLDEDLDEDFDEDFDEDLELSDEDEYDPEERF